MSKRNRKHRREQERRREQANLRLAANVTTLLPKWNPPQPGKSSRSPKELAALEVRAKQLREWALAEANKTTERLLKRGKNKASRNVTGC